VHGSYFIESAWQCSKVHLKTLSGTIECDEIFVGGKAKNMHKHKREENIQGRGAVGKAIVMGVLERAGKVRAKVVPNTTQETLHGHIYDRVEKGSNVYTDQFPAYNGLEPDFVHKFVNHAVEYVNGSVHTNGIENFWSLLKRGLKGTYITAYCPDTF
jgi:transposase-like protein